jgi:voltage-gated sodium channel
MTLKEPESFVAAEAQAQPGAGNALRDRVDRFVHAEAFRNAILGVIIFNAICLGLDTDGEFHARWGPLLSKIDVLITGIFVVELGLKLYADRGAFWKDGWNVFDFIIVTLSVVMAGTSEVTVLRVFRLVRVVRVLRVFRLFGVVPAMRRVVDALFKAIPGISAIMAVLALMFYVAAVITTDLYGREAPEQFGSIGASVFTLFQIMTGDGWSEVVRNVMRSDPTAWLFFIPFIVLTSFAVLNLFIAVIVDALAAEQAQAIEETKTQIGEVRDELGVMEEAKEEISQDLDDIEAAQERAADERAAILNAIAELRAEVAALRQERGGG